VTPSLPPLAIVYVGTLQPGGTCRQRWKALERLGHHVVPVDSVPGELAALRSTLAWRIRRRLLGEKDESRLNERLLALPALPAPDVLWVDKGLTLEATTLLALRQRWPQAVTLAYSGDDMFNPQNQSRAWLDCLPLHDLHVTTKSFNVAELNASGARDVLFVDKGFSSEMHRPHPVTVELRRTFGGDVGFVGWPEVARERSMRYLARHGVEVRIWGPWPRWKAAPRLRVEGRPLWDHDYARALSAFRINLGFLRRVNRDRHTTRSVEIPACGGFLLAERTEEHQRLFREGEEAAFFADDRELLDKVRHYLSHEDERARIAEAGLRRCREHGYSYESQLMTVLRRATASRPARAA